MGSQVNSNQSHSIGMMFQEIEPTVSFNWMSNLNSHWVEHILTEAKQPFLEYSPDTKLNFQKISKVLPKWVGIMKQ